MLEFLSSVGSSCIVFQKFENDSKKIQHQSLLKTHGNWPGHDSQPFTILSSYTIGVRPKIKKVDNFTTYT